MELPSIVSQDEWLADHLDLTPKGRREADYPDWPWRHDELVAAFQP